MTKEECIALLNRYAEYNGMGITNLAGCREAMRTAVELLQRPSLPPNLDEAAEESMPEEEGFLEIDIYGGSKAVYSREQMLAMYKDGAEWMAEQGWIDDGSMPPETKYEEDTMQGHREWTESKPVLAWDSMYGPRVDATKNGKWMSEQRGGYTGQIVHGIIAWRPIPEFNEELLFNARKKT